MTIHSYRTMTENERRAYALDYLRAGDHDGIDLDTMAQTIADAMWDLDTDTSIEAWETMIRTVAEVRA